MTEAREMRKAAKPLRLAVLTVFPLTITMLTSDAQAADVKNQMSLSDLITNEFEVKSALIQPAEYDQMHNVGVLVTLQGKLNGKATIAVCTIALGGWQNLDDATTANKVLCNISPTPK
jgi:phosphoribosylaminoimidazole carboxylase (NCAIR synthetase)